MSKVLANRLATHISELAHPSQSAFIVGRAIQDNLRVVQAFARWEEIYFASEARHRTRL
jgi:hypothetical protein